MFDAYLGTHAGVYRIHGSQRETLGLEDQRISAIHAEFLPNGSVVILAGSYGNGLFRSEDGGKSWSAARDGLTAPALRTIVPDPLQPGALLCGTEPARLFRSTDHGRSWSELDGIRALPDYEEWFLPYSPRAGALRNVYAPAQGGHRLLASVEVGGLLDSRDGGDTWSYLPVGDDHDIHHVTGHPAEPDLLYASLGYAAPKSEQRPRESLGLGGVARSRDGGATWTKLLSDYTRATIIPASRPDLLLAGPAPHVGREGRIVVSSDGGETWQPASNGITTPMEDMVELFQSAPDGSVWAICSGGRLLRSEPGEWHWQPAVTGGEAVRVESLAFLPTS